MTADAVGALDGLVIADFGRVLAGPYATMILADLGAEVVKIERPGVGDDTRSWGPPWVGDESSYFLSVNRNKKSVTLDLREREDLESARELVRNADVVVQNFLPGTMDRLGLGYDAVREMNPRAVYCSISGFGGNNSLPGYDLLIQAVGGLMSITGPDPKTPTKVGVAVVDDIVAALTKAAAWLGLVRQERGHAPEALAAFDHALRRRPTYAEALSEKAELIWAVAWQTRQQARNAVARYIDGFYNPVRRHSALDFKRPIQFERTGQNYVLLTPKHDAINRGPASRRVIERLMAGPRRAGDCWWRRAAAPSPPPAAWVRLRSRPGAGHARRQRRPPCRAGHARRGEGVREAVGPPRRRRERARERRARGPGHMLAAGHMAHKLAFLGCAHIHLRATWSHAGRSPRWASRRRTHRGARHRPR